MKIAKALGLVPQDTAPSNPTEGDMYYDNVENVVKVYTGSSWENVGQSVPEVINYISNNRAETDTTGWATYSDAAGSIPVSGTGGSANITWTRSTSSPLRGVASFLFTKDAANRQGQGVSYNFTIDNADQGKVLQISADFAVASGTYDSGTSSANSDLIAYIYDVTNSRLIEPAGMKIMQGFSVKATFQTSIDSTSYRLIIHQSLTGTSAYTAKFDNFVVGPQVTTSGGEAVYFFASSTNAQSLTANTTDKIFGTVITDSHNAYNTSTGIYTIKVSGTYNISSTLGVSTNSAGSAAVLYKNGSAIARGSQFGANSSNNSNLSVSLSLVAGDTISIRADIGRTTTTVATENYLSITRTTTSVASSETDTRVVALSATNSGGSLTTSVTALTSNWTTVVDTHGGFSSGVYTVKVPGIYRIKFSCGISGSSASVVNFIQINGSDVASGSDYTTNVTYVAHPIAEYVTTLKVGDTVGVRTLASVGGSTYAPLTSLIVERLSGPAQITATETVAFEVNTSTTAATTSTPFIFTNKVSDSHNAYSTSTGKFTAPVSGVYQFNWRIHTGATNSLPTLYVNGVAKAYASQSTAAQAGVGGITVALLAGQTVEVRPDTNATAAGSNNLLSNGFSGFRVGN